MFTLRCTKRLLEYLEAIPKEEVAAPSTRLGNWYANLVPTCRGGIVMCSNELTLLTVVLPLIDGHHPLEMLPSRVYNLFGLIGVQLAHAESEVEEMAEVEIGKSTNRRVLGSMNEIALSLQLMAENAPSGPLNASKGELVIASSIFSYTKNITPRELVMALLSGANSGGVN